VYELAQCNSGQACPCGIGFFTADPPELRTTLHACHECPPNATTLSSHTPSEAGCVCKPGFFRPTEQPGLCLPCPIGASCDEANTTAATLWIRRGFWRLTAASTDVRRCPDAAAGCSEGAAADDAAAAARERERAKRLAICCANEGG
jgi:hypothetical protein